MDYTILIGGEAGQGLQTIGEILARVFHLSGFYVFSHQDYMSRIRGGHNFYQIRISNKPITCSRKPLDIIVALNGETIKLHSPNLSKIGIILYDAEAIKESFQGEHFLHVPIRALAMEVGSIIYENTVAVGAVLGMLGMNLNIYEKVIDEIFGKKKPQVIEDNKRAAQIGFNYAREKCLQCQFRVSSLEDLKGTILINGNEAIGLGAICSGLKFYSGYPMTPSTGIMNYIASKAPKYRIIVEQAEDEIAAINMALGASFAGVRAMTASSGGGFALMVEGLSLAGMTEIPIVIAEVQRPGPATGLPTRTEQADLLYVLYAGHGEFPKVLFAPGTPEECFYLTNKAFDLAERFQIPVLILSDQYLADSQWTIPAFRRDKIVFKNYRIKDVAPKNYRRHAFTGSGISPFAIPGEGEYVVVTDSDEHDEEGHIIEDAKTRIKMVQKRLHKKWPYIKKEALEPKYIGKKSPEILIICWGSLFGIVREVVENLEAPIGALHFSQVWPLPEYQNAWWYELLSKAKKVIAVEQNATAQFARLLRSETSFAVHDTITKYDGRPFLYEELLKEVETRI